jgi:hypothetical protein
MIRGVREPRFDCIMIWALRKCSPIMLNPEMYIKGLKIWKFEKMYEVHNKTMIERRVGV